MTLDQALDYYLEIRTDDLRADILAAGREAAKRRKEGPEATRAVLIAMRDVLHLSFREIEALTYNERANARISRATAERIVSGQS